MESKHTPEPWKVDEYAAGYIWGKNMEMIADFDENEGYVVRMRGNGANLPQKENAARIVGNNVLCPVVLDVLHEWHRKQSGWWYGYTKLMIDVRDIVGKEIPLSPIKEALRELRKQGLVKVEPIYKEESGMLNGSGYFYNGA